MTDNNYRSMRRALDHHLEIRDREQTDLDKEKHDRIANIGIDLFGYHLTDTEKGLLKEYYTTRIVEIEVVRGNNNGKR